MSEDWIIGDVILMYFAVLSKFMISNSLSLNRDVL